MSGFIKLDCFALMVCLLALSSSHLGAGIPQPCDLTVVTDGGVMAACPRAHCGRSLAEIDAVVTVINRDTVGLPIEGMPASDLWLLGAEDELSYAGGQNSISADSSTNRSGMTTISETIAMGGCSYGVLLVVQGVVAIDPVDCLTPLVLPIAVRSTDCSRDGGIADGVVE